MVVLDEDPARSLIGPKPGVSAELVDGELVITCGAEVDAQTALSAAAHAAWQQPGFSTIRPADDHSAAIVAQWPY